MIERRHLASLRASWETVEGTEKFLSVKMSSFPECWCGYVCQFGENDGTGMMPDRTVVGG